MKLITSLTSPFGRKIRVLLAEKGLPCDLAVDIPWNADTQVPDYNPLGKVPALVADDGRVWFDSPVIAAYLETLGGPPFLPADPLAALVVRQTEALADGIVDAAVAHFLEAKRPQAQQDPANLVRQLDKIQRGLAALETRATTGEGINGEALSLGDIAAGCALGYLDFRFASLGWRPTCPNLAVLAQLLFARPSFATSLPPAV
ncbi:MAG: glutathione S-transferase [Rhodocyclaceae bacterium]|jgi:glutathione S-transferase|nr:glutathione S-transferase [Rhodocyclaceae bacterium]